MQLAIYFNKAMESANLLVGGENLMLRMILMKVLMEGFFCLVDIFWNGLTVLGEEGGVFTQREIVGWLRTDGWTYNVSICYIS